MKTDQTDHDGETEMLERRAEVLRQHVDILLTEADRRRHAATDALNVKRQVRSHPALTISVLGALLALAVTLPLLAVRRARKRRRLPARARALAQALGRMTRRPDRVAENPPHLPKKVLSAALTAIASTVARKEIERYFASRKNRSLAPIAR